VIFVIGVTVYSYYTLWRGGIGSLTTTSAFHVAHPALLPCRQLLPEADQIHLPRFMERRRARWHWVQQFYRDRDVRRAEEYLIALQHVLDSPSIAAVYILLSHVAGVPELSKLKDYQQKLRPCLHDEPLTYKAAVAFVNRVLPGKFVILSNGDISPWLGLDRVNVSVLSGAVMWAPARYEPIECEHFELCSCRSDFDKDGPELSMGSLGLCSDSYMFKAPLPRILAESEVVAFPMNAALGGDAVFLYELKRLGYNLSNPCKSIVLQHHHCSSVRTKSWNGPWINFRGRSADSGPARYLVDDEIDLTP